MARTLFTREAELTQEQQRTTRELEQAEANWLRSYGWTTGLGGRWAHPQVQASCTRLDALALTRAQPLVLSAAVYARK